MKFIKPFKIGLFLLLAISAFIIQCKKSDVTRDPSSTSGLNEVQTKAKEIFQPFQSSQEFVSTIGKDTIVKWTPDWDAISSVKRSDTALYYIPVVPKLFINGQEDKMIFTQQQGSRRYLIAHVYGKVFNVYNAIYISSDTTRNRNENNFFASFTGTLVTNKLGESQVSRYYYVNGQVVKRNGRGGRWEQQCTTLMKCDWSAWCANGDLIIESTDGETVCSQPLPLLDWQCSDASGWAVPWHLSNSYPYQDCQLVWIDDPSTPPDGGGGTGGGGRPTPDRTPALQDDSISDNLDNSCYSKVLDDLKSAGLSNKMSQLLKYMFGGTDKINVSFFTAASTNVPFDELGFTKTQMRNGIILADIYLNDQLLHNAPQELVAEVMMHEILHAYMDAEYLKYQNSPPSTRPTKVPVPNVGC